MKHKPKCSGGGREKTRDEKSDKMELVRYAFALRNRRSESAACRRNRKRRNLHSAIRIIERGNWGPYKF